MRVVCVDDSQKEEVIGYERLQPALKKGQVYTVRWQGFHIFRNDTEILEKFSYRLEEVVRQSDFPWCAKRFRPIDESKIDCLREHLTKVQKSVKEDA